MKNNKSLITWGVSFGSMTLVAGMVAYLGMTEAQTATNVQSNQQYSNDATETQSTYESSSESNSSSSQSESTQVQPPSQSEGTQMQPPSQSTQMQQPSSQEQYDTSTGGTRY